MPRKGLVFRRPQATDPVYASDIVEKFICSMMYEGKKSTAQRVFYGAMDQVAKKTNDDALKVFKKAIENVKPLLEVKTRRVGKTMIEKLADELIDASNARGGAMKKKEDVHRMAEANKAFAHYRW
jgi:small subunit ribosomal protein S7